MALNNRYCRKKYECKFIRDKVTHKVTSFDSSYVDYGNTGCGVFKQEVQNQKYFCRRINTLKGNY